MADEKKRTYNFGNFIVILVVVTFVAVIFMAGIYAQQQYEMAKKVNQAVEATKSALTQ